MVYRKEGPPKTMTAVSVSLVMMLAVAAVVGAEGRLETVERDLGDLESIRVVTGSIRVEVSESSGGNRIEASIDDRRELIVTERGGSVVVETTRVAGVVAMNEVIRLFIDDEKSAEITVGSGSVVVDGVGFAELEIDSGSGSVRVENGGGSTVVSAGSGRIEITGFDGAKRLNSGSGAIVVRDSVGDVEAENGSGGIRLDNVKGVLDLTASSGSIVGNAVTITGDSFFKTGSGRIDMAFDNSEETLSFDLDAGSGSIRAGGIRGSDRVVAGSGEITVTGRSGSGSQTYKGS